MVAAFQERRDYVVDRLQQIPGIKLAEPQVRFLSEQLHIVSGQKHEQVQQFGWRLEVAWCCSCKWQLMCDLRHTVLAEAVVPACSNSQGVAVTAAQMDSDDMCLVAAPHAACKVAFAGPTCTCLGRCVGSCAHGTLELIVYTPCCNVVLCLPCCAGRLLRTARHEYVLWPGG
eukprot:GHRQ01028797.1.p1 GENE.GHRQ01028797.1~~GHRQ01028797.1.p1  ORF type:complete len:172 (-),score=1.16 GHRQ01028797.1:194-709(-)